nr:MAG TPA: hypothetical protein [Caudoviricetes sp.]
MMFRWSRYSQFTQSSVGEVYTFSHIPDLGGFKLIYHFGMYFYSFYGFFSVLGS